jgi:hypothetical protein
MKTPDQIERERLAPAGVPEGATHQCRVCKTYYRHTRGKWWSVIGKACVECGCKCLVVDLLPIAEALPIPTPAPQEQPQERASNWTGPSGKPATLTEWLCPDCGGYHVPALGGIRVGHPCPRTSPPEEQLSGKVVCAVDKEPHDYLPPWLGLSGCRDVRPAEQPGKAAEARSAPDENDHADDCTDPNCRKRHTISAARPALPQAPAEPWLAPSGRSLAEVLATLRRAIEGEDLIDPVYEDDLVAAAEHFKANPPEAAAPLREERDRLARQLGEARSCGLQNEQRLRRELTAERAKVAERDARIATLEKLLQGVLDERPLDGSAPKVWHTLACPRCEIHAFPTNPPCLRHAIAAALGAPEGQPPPAETLRCIRSVIRHLEGIASGQGSVAAALNYARDVETALSGEVALRKTRAPATITASECAAAPEGRPSAQPSPAFDTPTKDSK